MNLNDCAYTPVRPADFDYDAALEGLREKIRRKTKIKRQLAYFAEEATRLGSVMEDRKASFEAEQEDVDALQGSALALLFYSLVGVKEEKLEKEEAEALSAKAEYEAAKAELDHVLNRQVELRAELRALGNCELDYEDMLAEKKAWLVEHEATVHAEVEALEAEKAAIIRDSKELREAMESGRYLLNVAGSADDALHTMLAFMSEYHRQNRYNSIYREHDIGMEIRNNRIRLENTLETMGRYLQDFAAELKDLIDDPGNTIPNARIEEALAWISDWVKHSTKQHSGSYSGVQTTLAPLVEDLVKACAAKEAACREIDDKIRDMVISK